MKRVILIVCSLIALLIGLPLLFGGIALLALGSGDSTVDARLGEVDATGYAIVSNSLTVDFDAPIVDTLNPAILASSNSGSPLFLGIGPTAEVERYLAGVPQTLVDDLDELGTPQIDIPGTATPAPPETQTFWVESVSGAGEQRIELSNVQGNFRVVTMNADGSPGLSVEFSGSAEIPFLTPIGIGMIVCALLVIALAIFLLVLGIKAKPTPPVAGYGPPGSAVGGYPGSSGPPHAPPPPAAPGTIGPPQAPPPGAGSPSPGYRPPPSNPYPGTAPPPPPPSGESQPPV